MYKLMAIDMDGTLLNSKRQISDENKEAVRKAVEKGVKVVITSGRSLRGLEGFLEEMHLKREGEYVIANNGGTIYRNKDFKCINYSGLRGSDLKKLYELALKFDLQMMAYNHEGTLAPEENELTEFERNYVGTSITIMDFNSVEPDDEITKVLFWKDEESIDNILKEIPIEYDEKYHIIKTMPKLLEVMDKQCNKGHGVKVLAEHLGIKREEIICIGDQTNDMEMISYAGLGIAMGNAIDEVKNMASHVTDDNDNNGVAKAIEKFIL